MQDFPHHYVVSATSLPAEPVTIKATDLPEIVSDAPLQFGGPGGQWSPEELIMAAVADCFILTFRAVAKASKLDWLSLECSADGTLDRVDRKTLFTAITVSARLTVSADTDQAKAERLLHKSEEACLITNSMTAETHLATEIVVAE